MAELVYFSHKIGKIEKRYSKYDVNRVHYCYLDRNRDKIVADREILLETKAFILQYGRRFGRYGLLYRKVYSKYEKMIASLSNIITALSERIFYEDSDDGDQFYEEHDKAYM